MLRILSRHLCHTSSVTPLIFSLIFSHNSSYLCFLPYTVVYVGTSHLRTHSAPLLIFTLLKLPPLCRPSPGTAPPRAWELWSCNPLRHFNVSSLLQSFFFSFFLCFKVPYKAKKRGAGSIVFTAWTWPPRLAAGAGTVVPPSSSAPEGSSLTLPHTRCSHRWSLALCWSLQVNFS